MSYIVFDVVRRYLEFKGLEVKHVQNFTDVDDKIINRANQLGVPPMQLSGAYVDEYFADADALNIVARHGQWWHKIYRDCVLTPHPGEMARLSGLAVNDIQADRESTARKMAIQWGKTIVLTGAMIPIAFGSSDGLFNLGGAITAVQVLPAGVYITMNGRVFAWDRVRKNRSTGVFEEVE